MGCKFFIVGLVGKLDLQESDDKLDKQLIRFHEFW